MQKHIVIIIIVLNMVILFSQENTNNINNIYAGKWSGSIHFEAKDYGNNGKMNSYHKSSLEGIIITVDNFYADDVVSKAFLMNSGLDEKTADRFSKMRNNFTGSASYRTYSEFYSDGKIVSSTSLLNKEKKINIMGHFCARNKIVIQGDDQLYSFFRDGIIEKYFAFSVGACAISQTIQDGIDFWINGDTLIIDYNEKINFGENTILNVFGYFNRIGIEKDTLGKSVKVNEVIETDKSTMKNVIIPAIGEVAISPMSKCMFNEDKMLEQAFGEIYSKIIPGHEYRAKTPQALGSVRGTEFITIVSENYVTTLTVLDGVVEFSDPERTRILLVKKNQKSMIKAGEQPSELKNIDPGYIYKWWK